MAKLVRKPKCMFEAVRDINRRFLGKMKPYEIGKVYLREGKAIYIEEGTYLDSIYGRVSNFWYWRPVKKDGTLGRQQSGYGELDAKQLKCKIEVRVRW